MPVEALCPTCGAVFNLKDEFQGKKVRCKKCEQTFTVGGEAKSKDRDEGEGAVQTKASSAPRKNARDDDDDDRSSRPAAKRGRDEDDDDDRPSRSSRKGRDDDDEDDDDRKGRKRKRTYADDDDDDEGPRRKRKEGGSGTMIAIIAGVAVLALVLIGGGIWGVYALLSDDKKDDDDSAEVEKDNKGGGNGGNGGGNIGGNIGGNNGVGVGPGGMPPPRVDFGNGRAPADVKEALANLRAGQPMNDRRASADWLAKQPVDPARQKEVARALEPLVNDLDDNVCLSGARALKVWGRIDNGDTLTRALRQRLPAQDRPFFGETQKELMYTLAQFKYEPGAEVVAEFLPNFFAGAEAERVLDVYGPAAERAVLKLMNHPDGGVHDKARRLLNRYGTKGAAQVDQTITDLGALDKQRGAAAVEWLARPISDAALQATNADNIRRAAVAGGLSKAIDTSTGSGENLMNAAKRWGSKEAAPALVRMMTREAFNKDNIANALVDIGKKDLRPDDPLRAQVVTALLDGMNVNGVQSGDGHLQPLVKVFVVWATKDDGGAVTDKMRNWVKLFCPNARTMLYEWMGKVKPDKAIPYLATQLIDRDDWQKASNTLQAMGPELGEMIEVEVTKQQFKEMNQLVECFKVLGAVGTKKSLPLLTSQLALLQKQRDGQVAAVACAQAITAIKAR